MKRRLTMPLFLACLAVFMAVPSCAGPFDQCVKPVISEVTWTGTATELGQLVASILVCDGGFNTSALPACALSGLESLATVLGPKGAQVVNCIVAYYANGGGGTPAVQERARAAAAKRGINLSLRCVDSEAMLHQRVTVPVSLRSLGDATPKGGPSPRQISENTGHGAGHGPDYGPHAHALAPEGHGGQGLNPPFSLGARYASCDASCGAPNDGLVSGETCFCWRGHGRSGHWVPLRETAGAGMVAAR